MFPFVPVTDPLAVFEKESGEQLSDEWRCRSRARREFRSA
jgi:hypothetical protein